MSANDSGYVPLHRKALDSPELAGDAVGLGLFVTLLLLARWRPGAYKGVPLEPGQVAVTLPELCKQTGLSTKQVRRRIALWHKAGTIRADQRANRFHVITLTNWNTYNGTHETEGQTEGQEKGRPRADRGQTDLLEGPPVGAFKAPKKERRKERKEQGSRPSRKNARGRPHGHLP